MGLLESLEARVKQEQGGVDIVTLPDPIDHLSASSVKQFLRCPRQWAYVRVLGIKLPPDGGLVAGKAFHTAAEQTMLRKLETGVDPTSDEAASIAADAAQEEIDAGEVRYDDEFYTSAGSIKDKAARFASRWAMDVAPTITPAEVEAPFEAIINGVKVVGRIDLIDKDSVVRDWKTSGKKPAVDELATSPQTGIYGLVRPNGGVVYHYVIDRKTGGDTMPVAIVGNHLARAQRIAFQTVREIAVLVNAGAFPRNTQGWHCSKKWCGFYDRCMSGKDDGSL